ncbi:MAG: hypothetical protein LW817_05955, partial [Candidatus Caenarcaniphilales bacterium]|nr:hypothetical protein [Candidatus Caenarcaniphilales bacterium]
MTNKSVVGIRKILTVALTATMFLNIAPAKAIVPDPLKPVGQKDTNNNSGGGSSSGNNNGGNKKPNRYVDMVCSGSEPGLKLQINTKSQTLDLAKTSNIRVRLRVNPLYSSIETYNSFKINTYEIVGGQRQYVSTQALTIPKGARKNRILSMATGRYSTPSKALEFDIFDTERNLINTCSANIGATNLTAQVSSDNNPVSSSACSSTDYDCQLEQFFHRVSFEAKRQRLSTTRVTRTADGFYKVTLPIPVASPAGRTAGTTRTIINTGGGSSGNGNTAAFGETLDISKIRMGDSLANFANFYYNPTTDNYVIGHGPIGGNPNVTQDRFFFHDSGRLGINVPTPLARLHVDNGGADFPTMILNPGTLSTTLINGAIEFDGTNLYLTKGGVRAPIGSGAGTPGSNSVTSAAIVNGTITADDLANNSVLSRHIVNGTIITADLADASVTDAKIVSIAGAKISGTVASANTANTANNMNAGTIANSTFTGGLINGAVLRNISFPASVVNTTNILNGTITNADLGPNSVASANIINGTIITDDLANLSVTNAKIVSVDGTKVTGTVANATNAVNATNATNAVNATTATNATNASNMTAGTISNSTFTGGTINGATLKNVVLGSSVITTTNILNGTITSADLGPNSVLSSHIVNGTIITDDLANLSVTDAKIVSVSGSKVTGTVANATNAVNATNATNSVNATNVSGGTVTNSTITNSTFTGGTLNGATLVNVSVGSNSIANNSVLSRHIVNGTIITADLADASVTDSKIVSVSGTKVVGPVANATTAVNATNLTGGGTITNTSVSNSTINTSNITNSTFTGGTLNGATLVNVSVGSNSIANNSV